MKIELDKKQLDEVAQKTISSLEKEVKNLNAKIAKQDKTIRNLKNAAISKDMIEDMSGWANGLVEALSRAQLVYIDP